MCWLWSPTDWFNAGGQYSRIQQNGWLLGNAKTKGIKRGNKFEDSRMDRSESHKAQFKNKNKNKKKQKKQKQKQKQKQKTKTKTVVRP